MTRRPSLPGAAELFRLTAAPASAPAPVPAPEGVSSAESAPRPRRGTGRTKHTTKITVYVSDEELLALEQARLSLRASHSLAVDRGRVVREAIAIVLDDLEAHGDASLLVRRLREQ
ncbi:hypothetical protein BBK82_24800 [Lentzea guizhouensis]|uniref:Cobyrinic acid a,c-diamide synthase n=1 Tax=Lentzea guizhouensis TaxID=1586287 RepID=A0A1B2HM54_9PSEU|nr:hypothetical protein [Lentzea guizhouensis]ANZ38803.1 hypothetical protein BBK82_24800 [Lentzea guizhouensis]